MYILNYFDYMYIISDNNFARTCNLSSDPVKKKFTSVHLKFSDLIQFFIYIILI